MRRRARPSVHIRGRGDRGLAGGGRSAAGNTASTDAAAAVAVCAPSPAEDAFAILPKNLEIANPISIKLKGWVHLPNSGAPRRSDFCTRSPATLPLNEPRSKLGNRRTADCMTGASSSKFDQTDGPAPQPGLPGRSLAIGRLCSGLSKFAALLQARIGRCAKVSLGLRPPGELSSPSDQVCFAAGSVHAWAWTGPYAARSSHPA